jgi:hypothetical protein
MCLVRLGGICVCAYVIQFWDLFFLVSTKRHRNKWRWVDKMMEIWDRIRLWKVCFFCKFWQFSFFMFQNRMNFLCFFTVWFFTNFGKKCVGVKKIKKNLKTDLTFDRIDLEIYILERFLTTLLKIFKENYSVIRVYAIHILIATFSTKFYSHAVFTLK